MAELTNPQKQAIVIALAQFNMPVEIVAMCKEEWGIAVDIRQVTGYDPTRPAYEAGDRWIAIFDAARKAYIEEVSTVPIANQGWRMSQLQKMAQKAIAKGNLVLAASLIEQASKEAGGVFTNVRNVSVEKTERGFAGLTPDERRGAIADMMREALGHDRAQTAPTSGATQ